MDRLPMPWLGRRDAYCSPPTQPRPSCCFGKRIPFSTLGVPEAFEIQALLSILDYHTD